MAIAAPSRGLGQSHPIPTFGWSSSGDQQPTRRRSLKRSQDSIEDFNRKRSQHDRPDNASQQHSWGGTSMRVGNVSHGRMELRPVPHPLRLPPEHSNPRTYGFRQPPAPYSPTTFWRDSVRSDATASEAPPFHTARPRDQKAQSSMHLAAPMSRARSRSMSSLSDITNGIPSGSRSPVLYIADTPTSHTQLPFNRPFSSQPTPLRYQDRPQREDDDNGVLRTSFKSNSSIPQNTGTSRSIYRTRENVIARSSRDAGSSTSMYLTKSRLSRSVGSTSPKRRTLAVTSRSSAVASRPLPETTTTVELEAPQADGDARSLVRLSNVNGQVMAATTTGLIAQITSPSFLDYDLLSDFFLTFRSYLSAATLMDTLVVRLAWAMSRIDDFGRIVRVRVFVALRHWILNYFPDDFVADLDLRKQFCDMINSLCSHLILRVSGGEGDMKVMGELKKCWRRTCAVHWDIPEHNADGGVDDIFPGTAIEARKSTLTQVEMDAETVRRNAGKPLVGAAANAVPILRDPNDAFGAETTNRQQAQRTTATTTRPLTAGMRDSDQSTHVVSCSLPVLNALKGRPKTSQATFASITIKGDKNAAVANHSATAKRSSMRPNHSRSGSFVDTTRDAGNVPDASPLSSLEPKLSAAGNLIRGLTVRPLSPSTRTIINSDHSDTASSTSWSEPHGSDSDTSVEKTVPQSYPPMKRLIGTMRKALTVRHGHGQNADEAQQRTARLSNDPQLKRPSSGREEDTSQTTLQVGVDLLAAKASLAFHNASQANRKQFEARKSNSRTLPHESMGENSTTSIGARVLRTIPQDEISVPFGSAGPKSQMLAFPTKEGEVPKALYRSEGKYTRRSQDEDIERSIISSVQDPAIAATTGQDDGDRMPQLKRMPGGNLRKADHVRSLTERNRTFSTHTSELELDLAVRSPMSIRPEQASPSELSSPQRKKISLLSSGSQPTMRPSFEREVARLRHLPDDHNDDGGVESALQKLEGRSGDPVSGQEAPSPTSWSIIEGQIVATPDDSIFAAEQGPRAVHEHVEEVRDSQDFHRSPYQPNDSGSESRPRTYFADQDATLPQHRERGVCDDHEIAEPRSIAEPESRPRTFFEDQSVLELPRQSVTHSVQTDRSTPLLERGVSQQATRRRRSSSDWLKVSLPHQEAHNLDVELADADEVFATDQDLAVSQAHAPNSSRTHQSFLLDHNQSFNDDARRTLEKERGKIGQQMESFYIDDNTSVMSSNPIMSHPLRLSMTPPRTLNWLSEQRKEHLPPSVQDHPPAEGFRVRTSGPRAGQLEGINNMAQGLKEKGLETINTKHLPFILGYSSVVIAQQFALIEKDALSDIDWRELIDLRWRQSATPSQTWTESLKPVAGDPDYIPSGVDICIARFNIIVNWAASEIVLCEDHAGRVACVIKYIHIAQHARQMQNWATMYQITTALVSADVSRLKHTWDQVPQREKDIMAQLEALIMPMRNFQNLRTEMERASLSSDAGCIPFIGIYTHDLIYNAQKPAFSQHADRLEDGERLINFDKHRTAAGIVKNLLRMLDASSKYNFEPAPELLSRCLWMACLDREEISARSKMVEP